MPYGVYVRRGKLGKWWLKFPCPSCMDAARVLRTLQSCRPDAQVRTRRFKSYEDVTFRLREPNEVQKVPRIKKQISRHPDLPGQLKMF
jgi:hypothetical protein